MSDPHGWDAQNAAIQAQQQAAAAREQERLAAGAAWAARQQQGEVGEQPAPATQPAPWAQWDGSYWAAVSYCRIHDHWGCAFGAWNQGLAMWQSFAAASEDLRNHCDGLVWITQGSKSVLRRGYIVVGRGADGRLEWANGGSRRSAERRLRRRFGGDSALVLLASVRNGVLMNEGLNLTVRQAAGRPVDPL